jgi:3-oxoacyl-[acyl-carrier-protein] synthase II
VDLAVAGSAMRTCLGDTTETYKALLAGESGRRPLRYFDPAKVNVGYGYHIEESGPEQPYRASGWLTACVAAAAREAGLDCARERVVALVGTGLRELRAVERWRIKAAPVDPDALHFGAAVRAALPGIEEIVTTSNACSASSHALAIAADLIEFDEADAVIACGADAMTESMVAMIGRVGDESSDAIRPFDADRRGVLLGEGAVAVVVRRDAGAGAGIRIRGVGMSCDAFHETAPNPDGVRAAMDDAYRRADLTPADVGLVVAHGTGTGLNDPTEAGVLAQLFAGVRPGPLVTAIKGAIGHTSGAAGLMSLLIAVEAMRHGQVPAVTGLRNPIAEAASLNLVIGDRAVTDARIAQINAFGFGGVNAVCLVEVAP